MVQTSLRLRSSCSGFALKSPTEERQEGRLSLSPWRPAVSFRLLFFNKYIFIKFLQECTELFLLYSSIDLARLHHSKNKLADDFSNYRNSGSYRSHKYFQPHETSIKTHDDFIDAQGTNADLITSSGTIIGNVCPLVEELCSTLLFNLYFCIFISFLLSLRPLDVEFMRRLSKVVNIVPVIAKADTLTLEERDFFKKKVILLFRVSCFCPVSFLVFCPNLY